MNYGNKMDEWQKELAGADSERLLLSAQVMICELARRHLEARQNTKVAEQTPINKQSTPSPYQCTDCKYSKRCAQKVWCADFEPR